MEIAVTCSSCKSTYRFDEEPVSGRLRFPVQCTNCGTDGTTQANDYIRKSLSGELELEKQRNNVWWKKIGRKNDDDETTAHADPTTQQPGKVRTGLGVLGAILGGLLGLLLWALVVAKTGREIGYVAVAVGALAGLGARLFVRSGSANMANTAALCAFLAIMGGQVYAMRITYEHFIVSGIKGSYDRAVAYAKDAAATQSDEDIQKLFKKYPAAILTVQDEMDAPEIRRDTKLIELGYIFMDYSDEDSEEEATMNELIVETDVELASTEQIARHKEENMPVLVELAKGNPSKSEFENAMKGSVFQDTSLNDMLADSWSPYQLLWIVLGVCSAYKIAYNKSETEDV